MTISLILNLVFSTAVIAAILGLLAWSIATQHRGEIDADVHLRDRAEIEPSRAPLAQPVPTPAQG